MLCIFPGWWQDAQSVVTIIDLECFDGVNQDLVKVIGTLSATLLDVSRIPGPVLIAA
jgi:TRAP-type mannitol/chloroaromatic compound transport system substrate-binding protein